MQNTLHPDRKVSQPDAGEVHDQETHSKDEIKLKLISVELKEASIDSPAFRASVNYFHTRIELFETQLQMQLDYTDSQYKNSVKSFRSMYEILLTGFLPPSNLIESTLTDNQAYLPNLIDNFSTDYYFFGIEIFKLVAGDLNTYTSLIINLIKTIIEPYKQKRTNFTYYQSKYDNMIATFQSINVLHNNLEPESIMEDSIHIYDIRKSYLEASLDLMAEIFTMRVKFDKHLIDLVSVIRKSTRFNILDTKIKVNLLNIHKTFFFDNASEDFDAVDNFIDINEFQAWIKKVMDVISTASDDLMVVKNQLYEHTLQRIAPSKDMRNYVIKDVSMGILDIVRSNNAMVTDMKESPNISGWLYMKTYVGEQNRLVWVRRWCFIQNSVFGIFALSTSKVYVEETDKFGVLNIDLRYEPLSQRKFCFHLYISKEKKVQKKNLHSIAKETATTVEPDIIVTLQAESYKELKNWFLVFKQAKAYASNLSVDNAEYTTARGRYPPRYLEFASKSITSKDKELTTVNSDTISIKKTLNCEYSEFDFLTIFNKDSNTQEPAFHFMVTSPPITTRFTQLALLTRMIQAPPNYPDAVLINIWGTTDWHEHSVTRGASTTNNIIKKNNSYSYNSNNSEVKYPKNYSERDMIITSQFKSIFYSFNDQYSFDEDEFVLFNYRGYWCPNKHQGFTLTCFITNKYFYHYMDTLGFISLMRKEIKDVISVEQDKITPNLLHFYYLNETSVSQYIYFEKACTVQAIYNFLLENNVSQTPKNINEVLQTLKDIQNNMNKTPRNISKVPKYSNLDCSYYAQVPKSFDPNGKLNIFKKQYHVHYRSSFDISPKGLLHCLLGDHSDIFKKCSLFTGNGSNYSGKHFWREHWKSADSVELVKESKAPVEDSDDKMSGTKKVTRYYNINTVDTTLRLTMLIDDKYYEIQQDPIILKFSFCRYCKIQLKYTISSKTAEDQQPKTLLVVFHDISFLDPKTNEPVTDLSLQEKIIRELLYCTNEQLFLHVKKLLKYYLDKLGNHDRTTRAINYFGMIAVIKSKKDNVHLEKSTEDHEHNIVDINISVVLALAFKVYVVRFCKIFKTYLRIGCILLAKQLLSLMSVNVLIYITLLFSSLTSIFYIGRGIKVHVSMKKSHNILHNFISSSDSWKMQRELNITTVKELIHNITVEDPDLAFGTFNKIDKANSRTYAETKKELNIKRNELLFDLNMLESLEQNLIQGNYRKFLIQEVNNCNKVKDELPSHWNNDTMLQDYCASCSVTLDKICSLLL
ncbi:hypothetical protein TPHA_0D03870 [Tetrapisispora phaffii CBS 4417]|uniref:PH domain-containing protein n=1 Tax=Tetrapisispora phaffii (strain ATCC 24235 / CBS 4417 / NBRC 1672 / NRRL Y-8282 / UCD 70-5) TaxID=1071381 RepID=G8BT49_TETPH|nr:hypothetical protein TPHA_0D03870 [Tetrapisispora phaffii CBS 4417]CCE63020.1 hypothetical protein TPHA_0D03870 [Tetrapisispora phaffii CBS 4417]